MQERDVDEHLDRRARDAQLQLAIDNAIDAINVGA